MVSYGTWFLTVPAIILQFFGICIAVVMILGLTLSAFPDIANAFFAFVASKLPDIHVSFRINLIQPFLVAYSFFCLVASLLGPMIREKFHMQWEWTVKKSLFALIGLCAVTYGTATIFSIILHKDVLPSILFFALTAIATIVAVLANALGTKIVHLFH